MIYGSDVWPEPCLNGRIMNDFHALFNLSAMPMKGIAVSQIPPIEAAAAPMTRAHSSDTFPRSSSRILIGSDNFRLLRPLQESLAQSGIRFDVAETYAHIESLWQRDRHDIVLLEVSWEGSIEEAVAIAMSLKKRDARQFVGYLADPILHNHGLTGDGVFPRDSKRLPRALHDFFGPQL